MNNTIRKKLFLIFTGFMLFLVFGGILLNILFLENFYIYTNKKIFIQVGEAIQQEYTTNQNAIVDFISDIYKNDGISCYITDSKFNIIYNSSSQKSNSETIKITKEVQNLILENTKELESNNIYSKIDKQNGQTPKIVLVSKFNNGEFIILSKPMKGISESAIIANKFFFFIGIVVIILGSIVILIFSKKITKPIVEMSVVAEKISNLEFDNKVKVKSKDEIGSLGESINHISEKLSTTLDELKDDINLRKELVRNMSHELKTPIGVIKGYAEGLTYGIADSKEQIDKYCNVIVDECDRMNEMVIELLEISKLEAISYKVNKEEFKAIKLINSINERFKTIFRDKDIDYKLNYNENIIINGDFNLIERALSNFITNAIKYVDSERKIIISIKSKGDKTLFSVFNSGKPIEKEEMKKIWNVFYKIEKARSRKIGGHGLGLSIVKLIVELHGGEIGIENRENGVEFYFKI